MSQNFFNLSKKKKSLQAQIDKIFDLYTKDKLIKKINKLIKYLYLKINNKIKKKV